jgi:hypothetical protein
LKTVVYPTTNTGGVGGSDVILGDSTSSCSRAVLKLILVKFWINYGSVLVVIRVGTVLEVSHLE